jgi:hypothetical protein
LHPRRGLRRNPRAGRPHEPPGDARPRRQAALVVAIANINLWNRLNVASQQIAGAYEW